MLCARDHDLEQPTPRLLIKLTDLKGKQKNSFDQPSPLHSPPPKKITHKRDKIRLSAQQPELDIGSTLSGYLTVVCLLRMVTESYAIFSFKY